MPQLQLPIFPEGTTLFTPEIAFECHDVKMTYTLLHADGVDRHCVSPLDDGRFPLAPAPDLRANG
jgi:hypothetical protein